MLYIKKDTANTLKVTVEKQTTSVTEWKLILKNDITQIEQECVITPTQTSRYLYFTFTEPTQIDLGNIEGSYTYQIKGDAITLERGKARVYDGTLDAAGLFGDEVTYTEHTNPTTNTQYIKI